MLGIVKEINGQKKIVPLTTDTGTGAPVGTLITQYKKVPMSGYLYCDGSTFDENDYPALYMYLGTNVLPDYRECVMVGAEQNTTDTIATHDVYGEGEFKDDQLQRIQGTYTSGVVYGESYGIGPNTYDGAFTFAVKSDYTKYAISQQQAGGSKGVGVKLDSARSTRTDDTDTTHGKQKAVYVYIKATSGLAENQQENVLNDVKGYVDSSNSYSTAEVKTGGKWIDGKPIYRKVVDFGALPNATTKTVTFDTVSADTWVNVMALAKSTDGNVINIPYADTSAASHSITYVINDGRIQVNTGSVDRSGYNKCYFKLEYTKTTD